MKGIILAEDAGQRQLYPLTRRVCKQLLPVFDKPMIYYPLSALMLAGIREILVAGNPASLPVIEGYLGDGQQWGIHIQYQFLRGSGLLAALAESQAFSGGEPVALIQGDHIFYGRDLVDLLQDFAAIRRGAGCFAYSVRDRAHYALIELDPDDRPLSLDGAHLTPHNSYAVPEMYFFDGHAVRRAAGLLETGADSLTALLRLYMQEERLKVIILGRGIAWLDADSPENLLRAANFVQVVEERQGFMISCPEEISYRMGWIDAAQLRCLAEAAGKNFYSDYLLQVLAEDHRP